MNNLTNIAVYCGSSLGRQPVYRQQAEALGLELVRRGINLIYGGGNIGLMGVIANTVLQKGGHVTGVIPHFLNKKEVGNLDVQQLILVDSMHERKQRISELADAFIAMPGGLGTLEEVAEMLTWSQLGLNRKPVGLLNVAGYYDLFLQHFDKMMEEGFMKPVNRKMLVDDPDPAALIEKLLAYQPVAIPKWLQADQT